MAKQQAQGKNEMVLQKHRDLQSYFGQLEGRIKMALPKHMDEKRMVRIALSAASRNPMLLECDRSSVGMSLIRAAEMGLECDGIEGALVPFRNNKKGGIMECQFIPMYGGLAKLAYQSELVLSLQADVVREGDDFKYKRGTQAFLDHFPLEEESDAERPMTHAYAVAEIKGGGWPFVVLTRAQVMEHKKKSPGANGRGSDFSPWNMPETEPEMWKKTAFRVLSKLLPKSASSRLAQVLESDDEIDLGDSVIDVPSNDDHDDRSQSQKLADEMASRNQPQNQQPDKPQNAVDPVSAAIGQFSAAQTREDARRLYDRYCGPESTLSQDAMDRVSEIYKRRDAELVEALQRSHGSLLAGQEGNSP